MQRSIERERRLLEYYDRVLNVAPSERTSYIREEFASDPSLVHELERLVEAGKRADTGALARPIAGFVQPVIDDLRDRAGALHEELPSALRTALAPRYRVDEPLGTGAMATVYLAFDNVLRRSVAVKVLRPDLADGLTMERFQREIEVTAALDHPRIVAVYESGSAVGTLYYIMRYVTGGCLGDRLSARRHLEIREAISIASDVANALDYAHARQVVHRDIKPENILLDGNGAYIADFGVARLLDAAGRDRLTRTGIAIGTAYYMSPEQIEASPELDGRSDVYSLACVLYEMLAGEPPYTGRNLRDVVAKHMAAAIPDLCVVRSTVTRAMQEALARALQKSAADRFASAREFVDAIERAFVRRSLPRYTPESAATRERTIAVLPFANMSGDASNDYFSDGVTEELIGALTREGGMRVVARTSCFVFKGQPRDIREIADALGATHVVEGSVRIVGRRLRAAAQLVDATTGNPLWSERFDRDLEDVFAVQDEITNAIVRRVHGDAGLIRGRAPDDRAAIPVAPEAISFTRDESLPLDNDQKDSRDAANGPVSPDHSLDSLLAAATRGVYEIQKELGRGDLCAVFHAVDCATGRPVSIKVLLPDLAKHGSTRARVIREAALAKSLNHPHIVRVYSAVETGDLVYFVMQFIDGQSLRRELANQSPLPLDRALSIAVDIATALDHAHRVGVLHGDLRPDKIMIDRKGEAYVGDFGLAVLWESMNITATGALLGTPMYTSPERILGKRVSAAADQYALGAITYELLAGEPPFAGRTFLEIINRQLFEDVPDLRSLRPAVPDSVAAAVARMLAKEPGDRFANCQDAVNAILNDGPRASRDLEGDDRVQRRYPVGDAKNRAPTASRVWSLLSRLASALRSFAKGLRTPVTPVRVKWPTSPTSRQEVTGEFTRSFGRTSFSREETPPALTAEKSPVAVQAQGGPTKRFPAYDAYLRGRFLLNFEFRAESLVNAIQQLDAAIAGNPAFAPAYAARAYARVMLARTGQSPSYYMLNPAKEDAETALELEPTLAEAHVASALVAMFFERKRATASAALDFAIEVSPAYADAHLWRGFALNWLQGRPREAIAALERAIGLDPLSLIAPVELAFAYWMCGEFDEALREANEAVDSGKLLGSRPRAAGSDQRPSADGYAAAHDVRAVILADLGRLDEALADALEACRSSDRQTMHLSHLGLVHALRGDMAAAESVIEELGDRAQERAMVSIALATIYAGLHDADKAFAQLESAYMMDEASLVLVPFNRHFATLRSDKRFVLLTDKLYRD